MENTTRPEPNYATEGLRTDVERRRPGRVEYTNPALIALLRAPTPDGGKENREVEKDETPAATDDLAPARGMLLSVALGASMWGVICTIAWILTR